MSQLGWIDFSPDDRGMVKNVLAMLAEPGTLDELGIGQVRDAFSDLLFPGISTIQTRAKYLITLPRIFRDYQALTPSAKKRNKSLKNYLKIQENKVAKTLVAVHGDSEDGIIGRTRIESGGVSRRPSVVYWNGLRIFSLVDTSLSLAEFCKQIDNNEYYTAGALSNHNEDSDDADVLKKDNPVSVPDRNDKWMDEDQLNINLTRNEAKFLKRKIINTAEIEYSVPTQLFKHSSLVKKALENNENTELKPIDVLTELLLSSEKVDDICKNCIRLAQQFSLAMEGPHIRYNIILSKKNNYDRIVKKYEKEYAVWEKKIKAEKIFKNGCAEEWLAVARNDGNRNIKEKSATFIKQWSEAIQKKESLANLDSLVEERAKRNKGERCLLNRKLGKEQWVGIRRLDYRWGTARTIINDIQEGLHAEA